MCRFKSSFFFHFVFINNFYLYIVELVIYYSILIFTLILICKNMKIDNKININFDLKGYVLI